MSQEEAERAATLIRDRMPEVLVDVVDPRRWMTLHIDRTTAQMLLDAVIAFEERGGDAGNLRGEFEEFLGHAE